MPRSLKLNPPAKRNVSTVHMNALTYLPAIMLAHGSFTQALNREEQGRRLLVKRSR